MSVALHFVVAIVLLFDLPLELPKPPKEQTVNVELVPPPQAKDEKKAEQKKAEQKNGEEKKAEQPKPQPKPKPKPAQQLPQSFASAMAKTKQDNKETELPPAARDTLKKPALAEQAKATDEQTKPADEPTKMPPAKNKASAKELKPLPTLAVPAKSPENATAKADKPPATVTEAKPEPKDTLEAKRQKDTAQRQPTPKAKPADSAAKVELKPAPNRLTEAKVLYSEKAIADPRFKQALLELPVKARIRQICTAEAFEQIRHQRPQNPPGGLVPFGPKGGFIFDNRMEASGGAYHSKSNWYDVDFKCLVNEDATELVSFSIAIGNDIVPRTSWEARRLPPPPN